MNLTRGTLAIPRIHSLQERLAQVGVVAIAAGVGAFTGTHPVLVLIAVTVGAMAVAVTTRPEVATLAAVALLYSNAPVIAHLFHGLPKIAGQATAALLFLVLLHHLLVRREALQLPPATAFIAGYAVLQLIGVFWAVQPTVALERVQDTLLSGLVLFVVFANAIRSEQVLRRTLATVLVVGALLGAVSLHQSVTENYGDDYLGFAQVADASLERREQDVISAQEDVLEPRLSGPLGDTNYYAQIMLAVVPIGLVLSLGGRERRTRLVPLVMTGLVLTGLALTFSRGAAVALTVVLLAMVATGTLRGRHVMVALLGLTAILILFPRYLERIETIGGAAGAAVGLEPSSEADPAVQGRLGETIAGVRVYAQHPVVGVGPGMFGPHYRQEAIEVGFKVHEGERAAHNLAVQVAAETGTIGLILFLSALGVTVRDLVRVRGRLKGRRPTLERMVTGALFALLGYVAAGAFLSLAYERYYWFLLALGASAAAIGQRALAEDGENPRSAGPVAVWP